MFWDQDSSAQNWAVPKYPRIVVALGLLQPQFVGDYTTLAFDIFLKSRSDIDVSVLLFSQNDEIIAELQNPSTVGIIFISHNFKTHIETASMMDASLSPIPSNILSAATPALRFVAFIGCHGDALKRHYQIEYELKRLSGSQRAYTPAFSFVTTEDILFFIKSGVQEALEIISEDIKTMNFYEGVSCPEDGFGILSIRAKDVVPGIESRFVSVNGKIVGVLGAAYTGGTDYCVDNFIHYIFTIPAGVIKSDMSFQTISIFSAELTPGAPADDYLISDVDMRLPVKNKRWRETYEPSLHLGDDEAPYTGESIAMPHILKTPEDIEKFQQYIRDIEWVDRNPKDWPPLHQRFFSKKIYLKE